MSLLTRVLRWPAWGCVIMLAILSLLPGDEMVRTGIGGHLEHAIAYAGTALLFGLGYPHWDWKKCAAGLVIYAGALEILQYVPPGRHPGAEDWLAGSIGVLFGIGAAGPLHRFMQR